MARLSAERRRAAIVDAALEVARRKGLAGTTVRDVAAGMGSSSGLVHHYFATMDDVLAAAFERVAGEDLERTAAAVAAAPSPQRALLAFIDAYAPTDSDWAFQLWLDAWAEAARRPALRATSERLNLAWQALVEGVLRDGAAAGAFRCPDPAAAAWRIISLVDGLALQVVAHRTVIDRDQMRRWAIEAIERELGLRAGALDAAGLSPASPARARPARGSAGRGP